MQTGTDLLRAHSPRGASGGSTGRADGLWTLSRSLGRPTLQQLTSARLERLAASLKWTSTLKTGLPKGAPAKPGEGGAFHGGATSTETSGASEGDGGAVAPAKSNPIDEVDHFWFAD